MPRALLLISLFLGYCCFANAQIKSAHAVKCLSAPRIDGTLDEEVWLQALPVTGFVTASPVFGNGSADSTTVKILYDNTSLYIGAYLYGNPTAIRKQFTSRSWVVIALTRSVQ